MLHNSFTLWTFSFFEHKEIAFLSAIQLCAPGMVNRIELAAMMSEAIGHTIEAGELPFDEWVQAARLPEGSMREGMRTMYADYDQYGFPGGNALVLRAILGREPRTLRQYIQKLANHKTAA